MTKSGANVRAISALGDLSGALGKFAGETQTVLQAAEQEIRRTLEWLQERRQHWQQEVKRCEERVRRCEQAVRAAAQALQACLSRQSRDKENGSVLGCRQEQAALEQAQQALAQAQAALAKTQAELQNVEQWLQKTEQAANAYLQQANRLKTLVTSETARAKARLGQSFAKLQAYVGLVATSSAIKNMITKFGPGSADPNFKSTINLGKQAHNKIREHSKYVGQYDFRNTAPGRSGPDGIGKTENLELKPNNPSGWKKFEQQMRNGGPKWDKPTRFVTYDQNLNFIDHGVYKIDDETYNLVRIKD